MGTLDPDSSGGTTYPPEEPTLEPTGECCDLISLILEKVDAMEDRLDFLLNFVEEEKRVLRYLLCN